MQLTGSSSLKHVSHLELGIRSQPFYASSLPEVLWPAVMFLTSYLTFQILKVLVPIPDSKCAQRVRTTKFLPGNPRAPENAGPPALASTPSAITPI